MTPLLGRISNDQRYNAALTICDLAENLCAAIELMLALGLIDLNQDHRVTVVGAEDGVLWDGSYDTP
jgi:hypothetical protein